MRAFGILLASVVVGVVIVFVTGRPDPVVAQDKAPVPVQKWEYRAEHMSASGWEKKGWQRVINEIGGEGWELVTVTPDGYSYFKRPKR